MWTKWKRTAADSLKAIARDGMAWKLALFAAAGTTVFLVGTLTVPSLADEVLHFDFAHEWYKTGQRPLYSPRVHSLPEFNGYRVFEHAPLWGWIVKNLWQVTGGGGYAAAHAVQAAFLLLMIAGTYVLAKELYDGRTAAWAALLVLSVPAVLTFGILLQLDLPIMALMPWVVWLAIRRHYVLVGVLLGVGFLLKRNMACMAPAVYAVVLVSWLRPAWVGMPKKKPRPSLARMAAALACMTLIAGLLVLPDIRFRYREFGTISSYALVPRAYLHLSPFDDLRDPGFLLDKELDPFFAQKLAEKGLLPTTGPARPPTASQPAEPTKPAPAAATTKPTAPPAAKGRNIGWPTIALSSLSLPAQAAGLVQATTAKPQEPARTAQAPKTETSPHADADGYLDTASRKHFKLYVYSDASRNPIRLPQFVGFALLLGLVICLVDFVRGRRRPRGTVPLLAAVLFAATWITITRTGQQAVFGIRYYMPTFPFLAILVGAAVANSGGLLRRVVIGGLCAAQLVAVPAYIYKQRRADEPTVEAIRYLKTHGTPGNRVLSPVHYIPYLADGAVVWDRPDFLYLLDRLFAAEDPREIERLLRQVSIRFVLVPANKVYDTRGLTTAAGYPQNFVENLERSDGMRLVFENPRFRIWRVPPGQPPRAVQALGGGTRPPEQADRQPRNTS